MLAFPAFVFKIQAMLDEVQRQQIAEGVAALAANATPQQVQEIGEMVYAVAALPIDRDTRYLLERADPAGGSDEVVQQAASFCLNVLAGTVE